MHRRVALSPQNLFDFKHDEDLCICRIAIVQVTDGKLGEEVSTVKTEEAPLRMALHPQVIRKRLRSTEIPRCIGLKIVLLMPT